MKFLPKQSMVILFTGLALLTTGCSSSKIVKPATSSSPTISTIAFDRAGNFTVYNDAGKPAREISATEPTKPVSEYKISFDKYKSCVATICRPATGCTKYFISEQDCPSDQ